MLSIVYNLNTIKGGVFPKKLQEKTEFLNLLKLFEHVYLLHFHDLDSDKSNFNYTALLGLIQDAREHYNDDSPFTITLVRVLSIIRSNILHLIANDEKVKTQILELYPELEEEINKIDTTKSHKPMGRYRA